MTVARASTTGWSSSSTRSSRCRSPTSARSSPSRACPSAHDLLWITVAMVGARSLAMALNRLIDAAHRRGRTRARRRASSRRARSRGAVVAFCARVARVLPRRRLAARPARALAVADPGARVRRLPVPEAVHVALPPLARRGRRARAGRRLGGDQGQPAVAGVGARRARSRPGSPASTSSTRSSTSRSTGQQGLHSWATRFGERGAFAGARALHLLTVVLLVAAGLGLHVGLLYWLGVVDRRGAARLRALARPPRRPAPARRGVLHDERRHLGRVLRLRARRRPVIVGLLHPGRDGRGGRRRARRARPRRALGSDGRSERPRAARGRGFRDAGSVEALLAEAEVVLSICPPHAALGGRARRRRLRRRLRRRERDLARARARGLARCTRASSTAASSARRRASRDDAALPLGRRAPTWVAALFAGTVVDARVVRRSALGAEDGLRGVVEGHGGAAARDPRRRPRTTASRTRCAPSGASRRRSCTTGSPRPSARRRRKGWRWIGEMEEIADTFAAAGPAGRLPPRSGPGLPAVITRDAGLAKRYGDRRVLRRRRRRRSPRAGSCSSPGRTARARRRCCACSPGSPRRRRRAASSRRASRSATSATSRSSTAS